MTNTITRSPRRVIVDRTNYVTNPRVTNNGNNWANYGGANGVSTFARATGLTPPPGTNITSAMKQTWTTASTNYGDISYGTSGRELPMSAFVGQTLTWGMFLFNTLAMPGAQLIVEFYTIADVMIGSAVLGPAVSVVANNWGEARVTAVVPAGAAYAIIRGRSRVPQTVGSIMYGTGAYQGDAGAYFDGASVSAPPAVVNQWSGQSNNTTSTQGHYNAADVFTPDLVLGYALSRKSGNTVNEIIGTGAAVVTLHGLGPRRGSLKFMVKTDAQKAALEALLAQQAKWVYVDTDHPSNNMTFALDGANVDIELDDKTRKRWVFTIPVVEG